MNGYTSKVSEDLLDRLAVWKSVNPTGPDERKWQRRFAPLIDNIKYINNLFKGEI